MSDLSRRQFIKIGGDRAPGAVAVIRFPHQLVGPRSQRVYDPGDRRRSGRSHVLRALLLEVRSPRARQGRAGHQDRGQSRAPAVHAGGSAREAPAEPDFSTIRTV